MFKNSLGNAENAGCRIFPFPSVFLIYPSKKKFEFWVTFILSSANALNFDETKILSLGKELNRFNPCPSANFRLFQAETVCRRQFSIRWKKHKLLLQARKHYEKRKDSSLRAIPPFPSVFKRLTLQTLENKGLFGKWLIATCNLEVLRIGVLTCVITDWR